MVEDSKEATGSMGDDTPVAVLSSHFRPLSHYFRQNFSQVNNPQLDSLRENKFMSLKTRFGNLGNILDFDNLTEETIYVLDSPILSNSQIKKFKKLFASKIRTIDCTFKTTETLKEGLEKIKNDAEISVRGLYHFVLSDKNIGATRANIPMVLAVGAINSHLVNLGLRGYCSINVETSETLDTHSFAVLIGVEPQLLIYLTIDSIFQRFEKTFREIEF